jgi:translation elongation factor EF-Ts
MMKFKSVVVVAAVVLTLSACAARAADCPAKSTQMDDIIAALKAQTTCDAAITVFQACESGASGDVQFGAVVEQTCEGDFLARLKVLQKLAYQRDMRACDRKYRNQSGTMYISFTAFCRAEVAQRYARKMRN